MKKTILILIATFFCALNTQAAEVNVRQLDAASRSANSGSIMFRQNAEQYRQLSNEEKQEIEAQREAARQEEEMYRKQQEEYMRRAREEAMRRQEAERRAAEERQRAEALKPITLYENKLKIYALVNGELITSQDMQSRINAFILTTGIPYNAQTKNMIISKVLEAAIDEKLKIQEAKKNKIRVTQTEVDNAIREFEKGNKLPAGQLRKILADAKVSMKTWTTQIEADIAWRKLINNRSYSQIHIGESAINRAMDEIKKDRSVQKWMVSEIVISKKDAKDLKQLAETLRHDPRFELYAMQFSQSPSSANGGQLGWITKGKLAPILENAVLKMKEGEVTDPIAYGNDYYILKLDKIFNPQTDQAKLPSKKEVKNFLENKKMEEISTQYMKKLRSQALIEKKI